MLIFPLLVALFFLTLSLLIIFKHISITQTLESTPPSFSEQCQFESFYFGNIWCYDNLNRENASQIPIVLIHSIGSSIYSWRYQIEHLSKKHRVIAMDLLGFGQSDKPTVEDYRLDAQTQRILALLEKKKIEHCHLVGCSLGGALCLWLKAQFPQLISRVIAICPAASSDVVPLKKIRHDLLGPIGHRIVSRSLIKLALRGGLANPQRITPEVIENYFTPFQNKNAVTAFLKSVSTIKDPRIFHSLKSIREPLLILWGEKDRVVPKVAMQKMMQEMPNATLQTHPRGGHHLMEDEPEWVNLQIENYLGTCS